MRLGLGGTHAAAVVRLGPGGADAAAVVQKTIKKLIPRSAGLLLLFLLSVKLEGRKRKIGSLDLRIGSHFATHS